MTCGLQSTETRLLRSSYLLIDQDPKADPAVNFEQRFYMYLAFQSFEICINISTMPNTSYLVKSLVVFLFLQPKVVSSGFYRREILWSGQKLTAPRGFTWDLSISLKVKTFSFKWICRWETISRLGLSKMLELSKEMYSVWTTKIFDWRIQLMESGICALFLGLSSCNSALR